jgi:hypothetical protein
VTKFLCALLLPALCGAAILPETIGAYHRTASAPAAIADRPIWDEYGLKESETATYENGAARLTVTAYRLADTTGAMAAFDWQRPAKATATKLAPLAVETADSALVVHGNYLIAFAGAQPAAADLEALEGSLKNVDGTPLPPLPSYLPSRDLVPNSERYLTGPEGLAKFFPGVPASVAAFRFSAEAVAGVYRSGKSEFPMAIFNYPTNQIAMDREVEFGKIPGAMVKRSGPLVAVVLNPPDPNLAEKLLGVIRYQAIVTADERVPTQRDNIGNLVVNAFVLIGILLGFAVVAGFALGAFRALRRRASGGEEADALVTLHLNR